MKISWIVCRLEKQVLQNDASSFDHSDALDEWNRSEDEHLKHGVHLYLSKQPNNWWNMKITRMRSRCFRTSRFKQKYK